MSNFKLFKPSYMNLFCPELDEVEKIEKEVKKIKFGKTGKHTKECMEIIDKLNNASQNDDKKYSKLINVIRRSLNGYDKRGEKRQQCNDVIENRMAYYYIMKQDDIEKLNLDYDNNFTYDLHIKLMGLKKCIALHMLDKISELMKDNDKVFYFIDKKMEKYYKNKNDDDDKSTDYVIYYLLINIPKRMVEIFNNTPIKICGDFANELKDIYDNIINNIDNKNILLENFSILLNLYEKRILETETNEKLIKSQGEFWCLIIIILLFNNNVLINTNSIKNPGTNRFLELDFYINDYYIAIEVDGVQHTTNAKQKINDKIKNYIIGETNLTMIRINWDNTNVIDFCNDAYDKLCKVLDDKSFISKDNISKIIEILNTELKFKKFAWTLTCDCPNKYNDSMLTDAHKTLIYIEHIINDRWENIKIKLKNI